MSTTQDRYEATEIERPNLDDLIMEKMAMADIPTMIVRLTPIEAEKIAFREDAVPEEYIDAAMIID